LEDGEQSTLEMLVQGVSTGGPSLSGLPGPESLSWMLKTAQGEFIEHVLGVAWPRCPLHGSHPLDPELDAWHCPLEPDRDGWRYGTLAEHPPAPEPSRADGEVRWYLAEQGWGVTASKHGDLFVHHSMIDMPGYRVLSEGQRVDYKLRPGARQGKLGSVSWCRPREQPTR